MLDAFAACAPFREVAGALYRETFWLVSGHLGTPRMVADKSGSLAGVKRHDYFPFGEEISAGVGGRTTSQGYSQLDGNRKEWAQLERDGETGLDYAQARYYSNTQGRFTSVDPENLGAIKSDPQSWNGYAYAGNSPLIHIDPEGLKYRLCATGGCTDYDDKDVDAWRKQDGVVFKNRNIYNADGNKIGTYTRLSDDNMSDAENRLFFGELPQRLAPVKTVAEYAWSYDLFFLGIGIPPGGGGPLTLLGRLGPAGRAAQTTARTIQIIEQEGNTVLLVGNSVKGEIKVVTEMVRDGDTLILKGTHIQGGGSGSMGVRELFEFARQFGKENGVKKVIIEGAERTSGKNIGRIPRSVEIDIP